MVALPVSSEPIPAGNDEPLVWVLHDGKAGMVSQSLGLAEATGVPVIEKALTIYPPWAWLPPQLWVATFGAGYDSGPPLAPPRPDLLLPCGLNAALPPLAIPRARASASGRGVLPGLRECLGGLRAQIGDMQGGNPYYVYLANADAFLVTADSVSMVSEAAATGKPVHIIELAGGDRKFSRFHATMHAAGITRPFSGQIEDWSYAPLDDTARAGAALRALVVDRFQARGPA